MIKETSMFVNPLKVVSQFLALLCHPVNSLLSHLTRRLPPQHSHQ